MQTGSPSEYLYIQAVKLILEKVFQSDADASRVFSFAKSPQERLLVMHEDPFDAALSLKHAQEQIHPDALEQAQHAYAKLKEAAIWNDLFEPEATTS